MVIANHMVEFSGLDEVWFVVTPRSPFKTKQTLLTDHHRYQMVVEATKEYPKLKPSNIEFDLPKPNYTINTLVHLEEKYVKGYHFSLIMGEDNLLGFHKWKNYGQILERHEVYVYPRVSKTSPPDLLLNHPKIHRIDAPIMEISATFIRAQHKLGKNVRPLLPDPVWRYMDEMNFYRT
jgi:nicotinate-nucleotide adenylyltransferase